MCISLQNNKNKRQCYSFSLLIMHLSLRPVQPFGFIKALTEEVLTIVVPFPFLSLTHQNKTTTFITGFRSN